MRVLVTSGRAPASLELIRLLKLGGHQVHVADSLPIHLSLRSKGVSKNHLMPPPRQETRAYGEQLIKIIREENIDLVIPTFEETFWIARFKDQIEVYCPVFIDELQKLKKLHSKASFVQLCEELKIQAPKSYECTNLNQILKLAQEYKKFVLKPTFSRFGEEVLTNPKISEIEKIEISEARPWVFQEFLAGKAYCSYALCRSGKLLASAIYPSEIKSNKVSLNFKHIEHAGIHAWVEDFAKKINFTGQLSFDFIDTENGLFAIECNPRMTSGLHLFEEREDFHHIFTQIPIAPLKPKAHVKNMMGVLVLLYGLSDLKNLFSNIKTFMTSKDIIFRRNDLNPFIDQFRAFFWLTKESRRRAISISKLTTADIEWNGEET